MNNAPAVYVPTQPEGDGLTMPTLLSLLAHGIVLGLLIYTYQTPTLEIAGSIETTMVSPGELAQIQGQILANRAAAAEQAASASSSASAEMQMNESDSDAADQNSAEQGSQQVPVFTRSDEPDTTTSRPMLMSEIQQQRLLEQTQEYERNMAELAAKLDDNAMEKLNQVERDKRQQQIDEQKKLGEFRSAQNKQPRVTNDSNGLGITSGSNRGSTNTPASNPLSLEGDGKPNNSGVQASNAGGGSSGSKQQYIAKISAKIKSKHINPSNESGYSIDLFIRVDSAGNVTSVKASNGSLAANRAAESAVKAASPLPIDFNNPLEYKELDINLIIPRSIS